MPRLGRRSHSCLNILCIFVNQYPAIIAEPTLITEKTSARICKAFPWDGDSGAAMMCVELPEPRLLLTLPSFIVSRRIIASGAIVRPDCSSQAELGCLKGEVVGL